MDPRSYLTTLELMQPDRPTSLIEILTQRPAWMADAACKGMGPEIFFPERGADARPAKALCESCPVREQCLDRALTHGDKHGIWGGLSERQRRQIRSTKVEPAA